MSDITVLRQEVDDSGENKPVEFKAVMGRADGQVKYSQNEVYVTLMNGSVITVYNERLPRIAFHKIIIGYDNVDPSLLQVLRFDNVYSTRPTAMITNHKESHAWYSHDPIDVYAQQFMPLLPRAISGLSVRVYGGEYKINTQFHILPTTDFDMSAEAPASGAEWVNAEIDSSGVITYNHGTNKAARELLLLEDIPVTSTTQKLLFSAKMYAGQSQFIQTRIDSDIFDPRFTGASSGVHAWGDIIGALADQADLIAALNGKLDNSQLEDAIADGVTNKAPSQNAVYDALTFKQAAHALLTALSGLSVAAGDIIIGLTATTLQRLGVGVDTSDAKFLKRGAGPGYLHEWAIPTTADVASSTNKRYVTDANLVVIAATSGANTGDQPYKVDTADEATLRQRMDGLTYSQHFDVSSMPAGFTWAGSPFVTPSTVSFALPSQMFISNTGSWRAFLYGALPTSNAYLQTVINYLAGTSNYGFVGLRYDDGSDNNYIELGLYNYGWSYHVAKIYKRIGGGAVTETTDAVNFYMPQMFVVSTAQYGTKWSSWGCNLNLGLTGQGATALIAYRIGVSGLSFTPTRFGIVFRGNTEFSSLTDAYYKD